MIKLSIFDVSCLLMLLRVGFKGYNILFYLFVQKSKRVYAVSLDNDTEKSFGEYRHQRLKQLLGSLALPFDDSRVVPFSRCPSSLSQALEIPRI